MCGLIRLAQELDFNNRVQLNTVWGESVLAMREIEECRGSDLHQPRFRQSRHGPGCCSRWFPQFLLDRIACGGELGQERGTANGLTCRVRNLRNHLFGQIVGIGNHNMEIMV